MFDWFSATPINVYTILAYLLILAGLAGSVIPVVPGPSLVWIGIAIWAWADGFQQIGWGWLAGLGALAIVAWALDFVLGPMMSRKAGASWRSIFGGIVGGLVGGAFLTFIPIVGTIGGALLGALVGMWLVEYNIKGDSATASKAVQAYALSMLLNTVLEVAIALVMVGVFTWRVLA